MDADCAVYGSFDDDVVTTVWGYLTTSQRFGRFQGRWVPFVNRVGRFDNSDGYAHHSVIGSFAS
jgi:hypothetical protein